MLTEREQLIVDYLRREASRLELFGPDRIDEAVRLDITADAIEAGAHLKRPDPTIPASEWIGRPSVGYGETG